MELLPIAVTILYGSSCVGKSSIMHLKSHLFYKVEMDDCTFWELEELKWPAHCLAYLAERIAENTERRAVVVTCGGLPLPTHPTYSAIEREHNVAFVHTLILIRYIRNINKRGLANNMDMLLKQVAREHESIAR